MPSITRTASTSLGTLLTAALITSAAVPASAAEMPAPASVERTDATSNEEEIPALTEDDLAEIGLTKEDAEELTSEFESLIESAESSGDISGAEAESLREDLLTAPEEDAEARALPVWAAAAIVGCAGSVVMGSGKTQIQNALKNGASVDAAADIAIDSAVDCVFGAVPGGAIGAAAKKWLTTPIKNALRPHVKKAVQNLDDQS